MRTCFWKTCIAFAVFLPAFQSAPVAAQSAAPQGVALRYKFVPGKAVRYKVTTDVSADVTGLPKPTQFKSHTEQSLTSTVQSVAADGSATIANHLDAQTVTATLNGQTTPSSPDADTPRDLGTVTLSPSGKIVSASVPTPGSAPGMSIGMDFDKLSRVQGTIAFPDGVVKEGDTWSGTVDLSKALAAAGAQKLSAQVSVQSTLGSIASGLASVNQTVRGTIGGAMGGAKGVAAKDSPADGAKMDGTLSGTATSVFDTAAGDVTTQAGTYTLNLTLTTPKLTSPIKTQAQISVRRDPLPAK